MPFLNMDYDCRQELNHWMQYLTQEGTSFVMQNPEQLFVAQVLKKNIL